MKGLKLNIKKESMEIVGNGLGLVGANSFNKLGFIAKLSPLLRGLATLAVGRLAVPFAANMIGLKGNKGGDVVEGVKHVVSGHGLNIMMQSTAATAKMVPTISGYEDGVYGMGLLSEEDSEVSGYEDAVYGTDEQPEDVYE